MQSTRLDAYNLMHEGALALAQVEANGIQIDTDYLDKTRKRVKSHIKELRSRLQSHEVYRLQQKRFGQKTNLTSRAQLSKVLIHDLRYELPKTEAGSIKLDESALKALNLDYANLFLEFEKQNKLYGTYLKGVTREVVDGYLRPVFNLHLVITFRSSSDSPNFQNIPIRNPEVAKEIRRAFIPRDGHVLVEIDYSALEFRIASCFWRDPKMVEYASDPTKDIHRDCAAQIFKTSKEQVNKNTRYCAKNMFVFPELYGSTYAPCAAAAWEAMETLNLVVGETPMREHFRSKGISKLGLCDMKQAAQPSTFEWHMKNVESDFYKWFPVLKERRDRFWKEYQSRGYFDLMTGFRIKGVYRRNFVLNAIIQGPAFHLLLWSVTQLVRWCRQNKTKTKIVGQIHDSVIADVHRSELDDFLAVAKDTMTTRAKENFSWVITPLEIEAEVAETNWYEKKAIEI